MKKSNVLFVIIAFCASMVTVQSCRKDKKDHKEEEKEHVQSTGNVNDDEEVKIYYNIDNSLTVHGEAEFDESSKVTHDLNVMNDGKIIVNTEEDTSHVVVGGNANIDDSLIVTNGNLDIKSDLNLNEKGSVLIDNINSVVTVGGNANLNDSLVVASGDLQIKGDFNLNDKGKVVIDDPNSTVTIGKNANINYSVTIKRGTLIINGDLNNNSNGIINCYNTAKVIVYGSLNQSGTVYGFANFTVFGTFHNNSNRTYSIPLLEN